MAYDYNDASSQYINYGDVTFLDGLTAVSGHCWVNLDDTAADHFLFSKYNGTNGLLFLYDDVGSVTGRTNMFAIYVDTGATAAKIESATNSATTGSWQSVGWSWISNDASGLRLYIDGAEDANSPVTTSGQISWQNNASNLEVGKNSVATSYMDGQIGGCALWSGTLTADDFSALANYTDPTLIQPQNLLWAPRFIRGALDPITGTLGTISGATVSNHHPLIMPLTGYTPHITAAASGTILPLLNAYYG